MVILYRTKTIKIAPVERVLNRQNQLLKSINLRVFAGTQAAFAAWHTKTAATLRPAESSALLKNTECARWRTYALPLRRFTYAAFVTAVLWMKAESRMFILLYFAINFYYAVAGTNESWRQAAAAKLLHAAMRLPPHERMHTKILKGRLTQNFQRNIVQTAPTPFNPANEK